MLLYEDSLLTLLQVIAIPAGHCILRKVGGVLQGDQGSPDEHWDKLAYNKAKYQRQERARANGPGIA